VFNKGTWNAGIGSNPIFGHIHAPLVRGDNLTWKNVQKTLKKNQTSLNKNQINPHFNPLCTRNVC